MDREEFAARAAVSLDKVEVAAALEVAADALKLRPTGEGLPVGRLGGYPSLGDGKWPEFDGAPMCHLLELDLARIAKSSIDVGLPKSGYLGFFSNAFDQEGMPADFASIEFGWPAGWKVVYTGPEDTRATSASDGTLVVDELSLYAVPAVTVPGWAERANNQLHTDELRGFIGEVVEEEWHEEGKHQVRGWPLLQQDELWLECELESTSRSWQDYRDLSEIDQRELANHAEQEWTLLLQLDSDDRAGWMWHDAGTMFFVIRHTDLAAGNFDNAWMTMQGG